MHPLDGAYLKIRRAQEHFQSVNEIMETFLKSKPYDIITEFTDRGKTRECILRFQQYQEIPVELPLIIGDICNNLRSALDYSLWQLWLIQNPNFEKAVYFPICDNGTHFTRKRVIDSIKDLSGVQQALIESVQPYKTKNNALSYLRDINNSDKHRIIQVISLIGNVRRLHIRADTRNSQLIAPMPEDILFHKVHHSTIKDDDIIAEIPLHYFPSDTNIRVKSNATVEFAFEGCKSADGKIIEHTLNRILDEVLRIVTLLENEFLGMSKYKVNP